MDISKLPFNELIGLEVSDPDSGFLVRLPDSSRYANHLGTIHGSALLAVAEAGSGEFLLRRLGYLQGAVPVVRRVEAKFRKPAYGSVSSRCSVADEVVDGWCAELTRRGRLLASLPMEVVDSRGEVVMSAVVEWFISTTPAHI